MNKCLFSALVGMAIGMYIGYEREEQINDICHESKKTKKKAMKKFHHAYDQMCETFHMD